MPDLTQYPAASDVQAVLLNAGIPLAVGLDYAGAAAAASSEWEVRTGWLPFLAASPLATQRLFDPPGAQRISGRFGSFRGGRYIDLFAGIVEANSCIVQIGYVPGASPLAEPVSSGVALIQGIQYYLRPNGAEFFAPIPAAYTEIEMVSSVSGLGQSISVWARWGRISVLPAEVWTAIARRGASILAPEVGLAISGGLIDRKRGDEDERFAAGVGTGPLSQQTEVWDKRFTEMVRRWQRIAG